MNSMKLEHILACHPIQKTDIAKAENTCYYDSLGKRMIDFESGIWCTALGHCHPRINRVMHEQIDKVIHLHQKLTPCVAEALAVNLLDLIQRPDGKAVFLCSGSEAVEFAIRLSRLISTKKKMLAFSNSYLSALSSNSVNRSQDSWYQVNFLHCSDCSRKECSGDCSLLSHIDFTEISGFVFEPAACGAVLFPPNKLVSFLEREVRKHGGIIIANEVTTGFGRTGKWFGYNHYDVMPDIVAMGKALGNGYPISAVAMSNTVASRVEEKGFAYVQSHQNDPLGCATAYEVVTILKEEGLIERSRYMGEFFLNQLYEVHKTNPLIKSVRGRGLMLAVEFNVDDIADRIAEKMLEKGYFIGVVPQLNLIRFSPALTMKEQDITSMCAALQITLMEMESISHG